METVSLRSPRLAPWSRGPITAQHGIAQRERQLEALERFLSHRLRNSGGGETQLGTVPSGCVSLCRASVMCNLARNVTLRRISRQRRDRDAVPDPALLVFRLSTDRHASASNALVSSSGTSASVA
ncbi:hypothetical protein SKAU_G00425090 [Synaphobranchus kaupii]|uniref:Uncharacterized protein n=1 Tax=Synaphobranchus kaupii TaxID=118154 RepID=A0A9Q1E5R3_SYNKA|nr:hypothetical protein SKAU_G00425090 [Synaphobranchus kaupii]